MPQTHNKFFRAWLFLVVYSAHVLNVQVQLKIFRFFLRNDLILDMELSMQYFLLAIVGPKAEIYYKLKLTGIG